MSVAGVSVLSSASTVSLSLVLTLLSGNRHFVEGSFTMCLTIASPSPTEAMG